MLNCMDTILKSRNVESEPCGQRWSSGMSDWFFDLPTTMCSKARMYDNRIGFEPSNSTLKCK